MSIYEKAKELAELLRASDPYKAMRSTQREVLDDPELMAQYAKIQDLQKALQKEKSPERQKELMQSLQGLQHQWYQHPHVQAMNQSRDQFNQEIQNIETILQSILGLEDPMRTCSGDCRVCQGCGA